MACSSDAANGDGPALAETVRALLDKGAHPNWRDASMRSSVDMVLAAHKVSEVMRGDSVK